MAHCLLNVNAKVSGLARYAGVHIEALKVLIEKDYGIIQLPCPEFTYLGGKRWGQTRDQYLCPGYVEYCSRLADSAALQVREYLRCGYEVGPVIGIDGSPSCGVDVTCAGEWGGEHGDAGSLQQVLARLRYVDGSGVFFGSLRNHSEFRAVRFVGLSEDDPQRDIERLKDLLR